MCNSTTTQGLTYSTDDCTGPPQTAFSVATFKCYESNQYGTVIWQRNMCPPSLYCGQSTTYYADSACTTLCKNTGTDCGENLFTSNPTSNANSVGGCYKTRSNKPGSVLAVSYRSYAVINQNASFFALHVEIVSISSSWLQRSCNATWAVGLSFSNDICQGTSVEYRVPTDICTAQLPDQKYWYIVRYHNKAPSASGGVVVYVYMGAAAAVILSMMIY